MKRNNAPFFSLPVLYKTVFMCLIVVLTGCSVTHNIKPHTLKIKEENGVIIPRSSLSNVIKHRKMLCGKKPAARDTILQQFRSKYLEPKTANATPDLKTDFKTVTHTQEHNIDELLDALLAASCAPAKTPGILHETLIQTMSAGKWPEDYENLFDLLVAHQRSYAVVEKQYYDMRFELKNIELEYNHLKVKYANTIRGLRELRAQHEKTIKGLSEIETDIDLIEDPDSLKSDTIAPSGTKNETRNE